MLYVAHGRAAPVLESRLAAVALLAVVAALLLPGLCSAQKGQDTRKLLLAFKDSFANGNAKLASWNSSRDPCNSWAGIACAIDGVVTSIDLTLLGLEGTIPPSFWALPDTLTELRLGGNSIYGTISSAWDLRQLTYLHLGDNALSGTLPSRLPGKSLVKLALDRNQLVGSIPAFNLPEGFQDLWLYNNFFAGSLPAMTGSQGAQITVLPGNKGLCGTVPNATSYVSVNMENSTTTTLDRLSNEACSSALVAAPPQEEVSQLLAFKATLLNANVVLSGWTNATNPCISWLGIICSNGRVTKIELGGNDLVQKLVGDIPLGGWSLPSQLESLTLVDNSIGGQLPAVLGPSTLKYLVMQNNRISGPIPQNWQLPPGLIYLLLSDNQLTGTWPAGLQIPSTINSIWFFSNKLSGQLPDGFVIPSAVGIFYFGGNSFSGSVPKWSVQKGQKGTLTMDSNLLSGQLPLWPDADEFSVTLQRQRTPYPYFCGKVPERPRYYLENLRLTSLPACDLESNLLSFKAALDNGDSVLSSWNASSSIWQGGWLGLAYNATNFTVTAINLAGAGLQGSIPPNGWSLPDGLQTLTLSNNALYGSLPWRLDLPASLERIDLSNNNLTGDVGNIVKWSLPEGLEIRLQGNQLSGALPTWQKPAVEVVIQPNNSGVCGEVLPANPKYYRLESSATVLAATLSACPSGGSGGGGSNAGLIAGVVVGTVGAAAMCAAGWLWYRKKRAGAASEKQSQGDFESQKKESLGDLGAQLQDSAANPAPMDPTLLIKLQTKRGAEGSLDTAHAPSSGLASALTSRSSRATKSMLSSGASGSIQTARSSAPSTLGVDYKAFEINFEQDIELGQMIGGGSFGQVFFAKWHRETDVAVKILFGAQVAQGESYSLSSPILFNLQKEAGLMAALRHPNIVGFLGVSSNPAAIVTEFCSRGSVADVLRAARSLPAAAAQLTMRRRLRLAMDSAKGLLYLHRHNPPILHRDFKSPNVLIDQHWTAKVCDFNLSKIFEDNLSATNISTGASNPRWLAPEIMAGERPTLASDVYPLGLLLWELLTFELPWLAENQFQIMRSVAGGLRPTIPAPEALPGDGGSFRGLARYVALMERCWAQQPSQRPELAEVLSELRALLEMVPEDGDREGGTATPEPGE